MRMEPDRSRRHVSNPSARLLQTIAGLMIACADVTAQNLLTNGSFELPVLSPPGTNAAYPAASPALTGWTIAGQGIDHDSAFQASNGAQTVSTCWTAPSSISQTVSTLNGAAYTITFDATRERPELVAGQSSTRGVQVWWNATLVDTVLLPPNASQTNANMMWRRFTYTVQGTGSDTLKFTDVPSGVAGFGAELDNVSVARQICPSPPPPTIFQVPKDVRCGDLSAYTAHYSIDALGPSVNNPGGYVTVGQSNVPGTGLPGLHVVRWNTNGTIVAERLFSIAGSPNESIIGTSVDADANCDMLVAGRIRAGSTFSNFVIRLNSALMPIGAGVRLNGPVEQDVDVQADWLADGSVIVYDRLSLGAGVIETRITRRTSSLGPVWSNRYHSFQVGAGSQFMARDIEQDPVSGNIFVCGTMNWPFLAGNRTLPMLMSVGLAGGGVLQVRAYDVTAIAPWTSGGLDAIKFNPSAGARLNDIIVAGWATRPGANQFDPPITVPQLAIIGASSLTTTWDTLYTGLSGWIPGTSAIGVSPTSNSTVVNNMTVAGRTGSVGGFGGASGFTFNAREPNGALNWAQRHGSPVIGSSSYGLADISPGSTRRTIGYYSDLNPFPGGGSLLWSSSAACPTSVATAELAITPPAMGTGEIIASAETSLPALTLQEWPMATTCSTICRGCFANCDQSSAQPVLNVLDFACFINAYASGDEYANCDESTVPPVLNVLDFACFLNEFATGCP